MGRRAILFALVVFSSFLKSELLPVRSYTTADGLAADQIDCIIADSRGFLWFCTPEGLSRFDGYHFVTYGVDEGLPHAAVTALIETRSGDHWIGTPRGLTRIATQAGGAHFTNFHLGPDAAANRIHALLETRSGRIWAGTAAGLFGWSDLRDVHHVERPGFDRSTINNLVEDRAGDLWIGTTTGIYVYGGNGISQTFTMKNGLPGDWVQTLLLDSRGRMWAAVRGGLALISRGAADHWRVERVFSYKAGLVGTDVRALQEASDGTLWVGTQFGISRLSWGDGEQPVFENLTRAQGLSDRQITALAEDQAGNMWAGTESAGVMRIGRLGFTTYREQDGLTTDRVFSVFEDRAGEVLAVTMGTSKKSTNRVDVFDGVRFHSMSPGTFADQPTWGWDQILLQSRGGEWWGATKQGLCRFGPMKTPDLDRRNPQTCYSRDMVFRIFEDSKGGIWASAQSQERGDQLMRWDPRTNAVFNFPAPRIRGGPFNDLVSAFAEDRQGNIWMGLYIGGLYRYNGREFQHFQRSDGVPGGTILALFADENGLWIGSNGGGLGRVQNTGDERPRVEVYNTARGLASNIILCITNDRRGRIYAGTGKGVDRLDPKTGDIRHFSSANGLAHGEFRSAFRDRSGSLWFATTQGLSRLIPTADRPPAQPRIFITDLRIGGGAYPVSQLGEAHVSRLELKPSQNQLQIEFVGLDYEPGDVLRYSYKLDGADSEWSPPRSRSGVNYAALSAGTYRFLVKAVTSEGVESAVPAEIDFVVLPPVWRRWWFEGFALALVIAAVFVAHRYRVAQMLSIERMRTAIATDLHDDIGASLSQIAILSEVARVGGNGQGRPGEPLERVASLARELVDSMGDIVWSIRAEPDDIDSLIRRMREFAIDLLTSQGIEFELRTPHHGNPLELSLQARRQLFLIFKECIHNAARHSRSTTVMAELKVADREVVLTVEDNGIGLSPTEKSPGWTSGTGIQNMRRRSEDLGGHMRLTSTPGAGCRVEIHIRSRRGSFVKASL